MKHITSIFIVLLLCLSALFAKTDNLHKVFSTTCEEYQAIKYLYISLGHSLPSTTGPWSADELAKMLSVLDYQALNEIERKTYDTVMGNLMKDA